MDNILIPNKSREERQNKLSLLGHLFAYLKKPTYREELENIKASQKLKNIFKLWSFSIVLTFLSGLLLSYLIARTGYNENQHSVVDLFANYPLIVFMFLAFVWGPLTEEFTFRMGMKFSPYKTGFSLAFLLLTALSAILVFLSNSHFGFSLYMEKTLESLGLWGVLVYFLVLILSGFLFSFYIKHRVSSEAGRHFYLKNFTWIFYGSSILFAFVHLFNFSAFSQVWHLAPLLVAPQFFLGLVLAFVRMVYGLQWSIFLHFMHNALITIPVILVSRLSEDLLSVIEAGDGAIEAFEIGIVDSILILVSTVFTLILLLLISISFVSVLQEYYKNKHLLRK